MMLLGEFHTEKLKWQSQDAGDVPYCYYGQGGEVCSHEDWKRQGSYLFVKLSRFKTSLKNNNL